MLIPQTKLGRSVASAIAGMLVYGGWAVYANFDHGLAIAQRSGFVQGSYSFVLTFLMTLVTESLFAKIAPRYRMALTTVLVSVILFTSAYSIHMLVGTPEILMTIFPGFVIGTAYTLVYVIGLTRAVQLRAQTVVANEERTTPCSVR